MSLDRTHARFATTCWSLVRTLEADGAGSREAGEELARRYWPPVYAYLRRSGKGREEAGELTQGFFAEVVVSRGLFERANPDAGRLRTLLLTALNRYLVDQHRRGTARGAGRLVPLEAMAAEEGRIEGDDATQAYERRWAVSQLEEAMRRCERRFRSSGRGRHWEAFEARVLGPSVSATTPTPLSELAPRLGFSHPGDVAAAVQVVRKRALAILREVIAESVRDDEEADREYAETIGLFV